MDKDLVLKLRIAQGQAIALIDSISDVAGYAPFEAVSTPYQQAHILLAHARQILMDTSFAGTLPLLQSKVSVDGTYYVEAQDIRTMASMLNASLNVIIEAYGTQGEDAVSKVAALESKLAEVESRSITLKDDELRDRCLDLLLRPGKADTAIREAAVVLEDRIRKVSELEASDIGVVLVDKVLNPRAGVLTFEGPDSERRAMHELFRGAMGVFRNPTSHKIVPDYDVTRARQVVGLVDVLLQLLQETRRRDPVEVAGDDSNAT